MTPEDFPKAFADGWAKSKPGPFLDYFLPLLHPNVTFEQPMLPVATGPRQVEQMFRRLFALLPDLTAFPRHFAVDGEVVFIESDCDATIGRKPVHFTVCDRFLIRDGLIVERCSYSDSLPFLLTSLRRPSSWPRLLSRV